MIDLCKYTQHECELICPQSRDCMRQPPDELCARSSRCYSWFPRADSPGSVSGILCCAGITIQRCVDIAQGAKAASCTFPPVFMPRTAELRAGGGLGPPVPAKQATSSVCDLLHSCSRDLAAGDKLDGLQAASQVQLHPFSQRILKGCTDGHEVRRCNGRLPGYFHAPQRLSGCRREAWPACWRPHRCLCTCNQSAPAPEQRLVPVLSYAISPKRYGTSQKLRRSSTLPLLSCPSQPSLQNPLPGHSI